MTKFLFHALFNIQPLLEGLVLWFMFRRHLHRRYPLFFSFVIFNFLSWFVYYFAHSISYSAYFYAYWTVAALYALMSFAVIYEIFTSMFRRHEGLRDFGTVLFQWSGVVVVMMGMMMLATGAGFAPRQIVAAILSIERAVGIMQCGLLLLVVLFSSHLALTWRHQIFGITLGLGVSAAVELILFTQRIRGVFGDTVLSMMHMTAFDIMLLIWLGYMLLPVPAEVVPNLLLRTQRWSEALVDVTMPETDQTVLVGIQSIVDRAFTKRSGPSEPDKS
jgi:hypothetical protein